VKVFNYFNKITLFIEKNLNKNTLHYSLIFILLIFSNHYTGKNNIQTKTNITFKKKNPFFKYIGIIRI